MFLLQLLENGAIPKGGIKEKKLPLQSKESRQRAALTFKTRDEHVCGQYQLMT